jgi:hypothetical protein
MDRRRPTGQPDDAGLLPVAAILTPGQEAGWLDDRRRWSEP